MNTDTTSSMSSFGTTLDQIDALNHLIGRIRANGDVIATGGADELADGSLCAIGESIFETACEVREIVDQIETQRLAQIATASKPGTMPAGQATFDSDMDGALLQAFSVMQLMHIAANEDKGLDDASSACQLVSQLVWKVHEYVAANFDALPKFAGPERPNP